MLTEASTALSGAKPPLHAARLVRVEMSRIQVRAGSAAFHDPGSIVDYTKYEVGWHPSILYCVYVVYVR